MFAALEGTIDQQRERRRDGAPLRVAVALRAGGAHPAARHADRSRGRRRRGLAGGGLLLERAMARADRRQRLPQRRAYHAHEQGAGQAAGTRPGAQHGRAELARVAAAAEFATPETERARDKQAGTILEWQQYGRRCARHPRHAAAAAMAARRRSPTTLIVHLSDDAPPLLEGAGPLSVETAESARLRRAPAHDQAAADATSCTRASGAAPPTRSSARCYKRSGGHCQYPGCTAAARARGAPPHRSRASAAGRSSTTSSCSAPATTSSSHDHHIRTSGNGERPAFADEAGRAITTNQPHAPPR